MFKQFYFFHITHYLQFLKRILAIKRLQSQRAGAVGYVKRESVLLMIDG